MNKSYKVTFNRARGCMMVVNELTSSVQKKSKVTVVSAAVLVALSSSAYATSIVDESTEFKTNTIIEVSDETSVEGNNRHQGIGTTNGTMKTTVAPGATLTVKGSTENKNWTRVYGVNTKTGSKLDVVGNLDLNLTAVAGTQARGVRSYGNTTITGNLTGTVVGNDVDTTGVEVWDGAHLQIKGTDSNLKVITEGGRAIGVNNHAASGIPAGTVDFNGHANSSKQ